MDTTNTATAATETPADENAIVLTPELLGLLPFNPTTGRPYSGKNGPALLEAAAEAGRSSGEWAGFHQWAEAGRMVRKGEKGTQIQQLRTKKGEAADGSDDRRYATTVTVFHVEQTGELTDDERREYLDRKAARAAARKAKPRKSKGRKRSSRKARAAA